MTTSRVSLLGLYRPVGALLLSLTILFLQLRPGDALVPVAAGPDAAAPTAVAPTDVPAAPQAAAPTVAVPTIAALAPVSAAPATAVPTAAPTAVAPSPSPAPPEPTATAVPETPTPAVVPTPGDSGRVYVVERHDWLKTLAQRFYGDSDLYTLIMDTTNARAEVDPSFSKITDEDILLPGQKLWIPDKPAS